MRDLLHNIFGGSIAGAQIQNSGLHPAMNQAVKSMHVASNKKIFSGRVEVMQVTNGFVVQIGTREGYEFETYIAANITEVNEIIAAQIVAFKLEDK